MSQEKRNILRSYAAERGAKTVPDETYQNALNQRIITLQDLKDWNMPTERIQNLKGDVTPPLPPTPAATPKQTPAPEDPYPNKTLLQIVSDVNNGILSDNEVISAFGLTTEDWENIRRHYNENPIPTWSNTPVLKAKKTDLWVFGIPGSGKTVMLSAILGRLSEKGYLMAADYSEVDENSYKYRNYLTAAYKLKMFPEPTPTEGFNFVPMDLTLPNGQYRPANLIEMAGEKVQNLIEKRDSTSDSNALSALEWLKSNNKKVITFVLDITSRNLYQSDELSLVVGLLKSKGVFQNTTKIILLATKTDILKSFDRPHSNALQEEVEQKIQQNFNSLSMQVNQLRKKGFFGSSKIEVVTLPFSVGSDIIKDKYLKGDRHNKFIDDYLTHLVRSIEVKKPK